MLKLHLYVLVAQDNICTAGLRTTAGSKVLDTYLPPFDATAVAKLKAAGAVLIGKTNMDEFGMGSTTENSSYKVRRCWYNICLAAAANKQLVTGTVGCQYMALACLILLGPVLCGYADQSPSLRVHKQD